MAHFPTLLHSSIQMVPQQLRIGKQTKKTLFIFTTQGKLSVLNTPATYHWPYFFPSADFLTPLCAVVLNGCLSKNNENPWHQRLRVFPNTCSHTQLNPFHVSKFLIQHIQGFIPTSSLLKTWLLFWNTQHLPLAYVIIQSVLNSLKFLVWFLDVLEHNLSDTE